MRILVALLLSCATAFAGKTNTVRVATTSKTNSQSGSVTTVDVFTRNGETNLMRHTKIKGGILQIRIHRFYHGGGLVGDFIAMPNSSSFSTEAGSPHAMSFEFGAAKEVKSAVIASKEAVILDLFTCTNGVFTPAESSHIGTANATGKAVQNELEKYKTR